MHCNVQLLNNAQSNYIEVNYPMTTEEFNKEDYEAKIAELEKQLKEKSNDDSFSDLKEKYEKIIADKNKEIAELNKTVDLTQQKVDTTVNELNDEVKEKLEQSEKLLALQKNVDELLQERAEVTVDNYIQKGIIPTSKRDTAVKLCLNDNDTFMELYRDAQPIIDVKQQKSKKINADIGRLVDYFKN